jgi:hypothetical protein
MKCAICPKDGRALLVPTTNWHIDMSIELARRQQIQQTNALLPPENE